LPAPEGLSTAGISSIAGQLIAKSKP